MDIYFVKDSSLYIHKCMRNECASCVNRYQCFTHKVLYVFNEKAFLYFSELRSLEEAEVITFANSAFVRAMMEKLYGSNSNILSKS